MTTSRSTSSGYVPAYRSATFPPSEWATIRSGAELLLVDQLGDVVHDSAGAYIDPALHCESP